jgi:hypothetical protein
VLPDILEPAQIKALRRVTSPRFFETAAERERRAAAE